MPRPSIQALTVLMLLAVRTLSSNVNYTTLISHLFSDYVKEVRPALNHLDATETFLSMALTAIDNLEERNQILVTSVVIGIGYDDEYLSWEPRMFGNIEYLIYPQARLWLPDLVVDNSMEKLDQLGYDEMPVMIQSSGKVMWRIQANMRTTCSVDVTYYPFDTQTCNIVLSTWTSSSKDVRLQINRQHEIILDGYQESGAWELVSTSIQDLSGRSLQNRLSFSLTIKRRKAYYVLNLIVPVISLSATASLVFWLPADAGEKVGMSITVLLAYAVYLTVISDSIPRTSLQVSIMGVYLSILLGATSLAVVCTVFVLNLHHHGDDDAQLPPGRTWRSFAVTCRPLIGLPDLCGDVTGNDEERGGGHDGSCPKSKVGASKKWKDKKKPNNKILSLFHSNKVGHASDFNVSSDSPFNHPPKVRAQVVVDDDAAKVTQKATPKVSWRQVAETVDRLLFILFTTFTGVSSLVFFFLLTFGYP